MKQKIISFIETLLIMSILAIIGFIGIMIYEYYKEDIVGEVQNFVSNITILETEKVVKKENQIAIQIEQSEKIENINNPSKRENYFYKQLDKYSKMIYNGLDKNKENMKTGTYKIEFGEKFSPILSKENGQEILGDYYQTAIEAYIYDNPEIFYIDYSKLQLNTEIKTTWYKKTYNVYIDSGDKGNYLEEGFNSKEDINNALGEIEKIKEYFVQNKKTSTYENIKSVHDYLVESIEYEQTQASSNIYNLYGALINKRCVCEGYAEAFKYLMDALEIPCVIITGQATNLKGDTENHAWNYVQIDNIWYAIDCTWDDPIIEGPQIFSKLYRYKYFLKGENEFNESHNPSRQFTEEGNVFAFPTISTENY